MTIIERISGDIVTSQKAGETDKLAALRFILNALQSRAKELRQSGLDDLEALKVLQKEVKKRREALAAFETGGRTDLAAKEQAEISLIEPYLPVPLTDEQIAALIAKAVTAAGLTPPYDFGRLMGLVMKEVGGQADGNRVRERLQEFIKQAT